jgi:hypothetical protein
MENKNILPIILVVAIAAVIVVGIVLYSSSQSQISNINSQLNTANLNINSSASQFDSQFSDLLQQNTFLLIDTARRSLTANSSSFNATLGALQTNINQVGALLQPIYGNNSNQLVALWNLKANIYVNYSNSLRNGDPNAQAYYNAAEAAYQPQVVQFWTTTSNPYPVIDSATISELVSANAADIKSAIDAWYAGNYNLYYTEVATSYQDMGTYADVIANGIIQQNPQDFQ